MFKIIVVEIRSDEPELPRFEQTVDSLDFHKLAVLCNPPPKRVYKRKEAKG